MIVSLILIHLCYLIILIIDLQCIWILPLISNFQLLLFYLYILKIITLRFIWLIIKNSTILYFRFKNLILSNFIVEFWLILIIFYLSLIKVD